MIDVELSLDALSKHVRAIEASEDKPRQLGHVLALARLLRSDRVLSATLRDLEGDALAVDAARVSEISRTLEDGVETSLRRLAYEYQRVGPEADAWRAIVDEREHTGKASTKEPFKALLHRLRIGNHEAGPAGLRPNDVISFAELSISPLEQRASASRVEAGVLYHLRQLKAFAEGYRKLHDFEVLCNAGAVTSIARRFDELLTVWEQRLLEGPKGENWTLPDDGGLHRDARTIASRLETALAGRRSRRLVLYRAKVYFEHFFYIEARAALKAEEKRVADAKADGRRASAQRESVLRHPFDRFIFQEGFFPITEAKASRGRLDMLLTDADNAGIRPLLIEIKQAARIEKDDVSREEVRNAIAEARAEIARYAGNLRAQARWAGIEPMVVVFHTSSDDVSSLADDSTVLIDIGKATPSQVIPASDEPDSLPGESPA